MAKKESRFQKELIDEIEERFPGSVVFKTHPGKPGVPQGFPDIVILHGERWAALECKKEDDASRQPNQPYYVEMLGEMSYASFIYPENKERVLNEIQRTFESKRAARVSRSKHVQLA